MRSSFEIGEEADFDLLRSVIPGTSKWAQIMNEPRRHIPYDADTKCSVEGCAHSAEYEVYLYDYYESLQEEFYEQDYTCPFLCDAHMEQNEREMRGVRAPRMSPNYPFTNRHGAQGYAMYAPLSEIFPILYAETKAKPSSILIESASEINEQLIKYLTRHPEFMRHLDPRKFEELVAELLQDQGFVPTLTPKTHDGGYDIIATRSDALGDLLYLVECKRYAQHRKVSVEYVRGIYGVAQEKRATKAVLVTTSSFTKSAIDFAAPLKYDIALHDFDVLQHWLSRYRSHR